MSEQPDFAAWGEKFRYSLKGKEALDKLKGVLWHYHPDDYETFQGAILFSCYCAVRYDPKNDQNAMRRAAERKSIPEEMEGQTRAVKSILSFARKQPYDFIQIMLSGYKAEREKEKKQIPIKIRPDVLLQQLLNIYASGLSAENPWLGSGTFMHSLQVGNMLFAEPKDKKNSHNRTITETMLAFELAMRFRRWTAKQSELPSYQNAHICIANPGEPIPQSEPDSKGKIKKYGKPCHDLVALFVNVTLNSGLNEESVKSTLSKIPPETGLVPWPVKVENPPK